MKKLSELNIETKVFFSVLLFLFILGVLFIKKDPFFSYTNLSLSAGFLIGFIYFYRIGRLKISKGKEKYKVKEGVPWKKVSIKIKGCPFVLLGVLLVLWVIDIIEGDFRRSEPFIRAGAISANITLFYFYAVGRLDVYKHDAQVQKKNKNLKG
ncbi:MAG TPA: hypothetical protein ENI50_00185 [Euryarchaeota archaeon]|nr:hypothetical protein [Euryarchaeota archaeon]